MSLKNSGPNGVPSHNISTVRLDVSASKVGANNTVAFTLPPTYISGSSITADNNDPDLGGRVVFNESGVYSACVYGTDSNANNLTIVLFKPGGGTILSPTTDCTIKQESLAICHTPGSDTPYTGACTFYAKPGWYISQQNSSGAANLDTMAIIVTKVS